MSEGLVTAYVKNTSDENHIAGTSVNNLLWLNLLENNYNEETSYSRVTSSIGSILSPTATLAQLRTDTDHPIYSLKDIILSASYGGIPSSSSKGIQLRWPHIAGAEKYQIQRRNLADPESDPQNIDYTPPTLQAISQYINYEDVNGVLPNEIYRYTVTAIGADNNRLEDSEPGEDNGFVFANGAVEGTLETSTGIATQNALLRAKVAEGNIPGNALRFSNGSRPININDISLFREAGGTGTIEFWYRTPTVRTGTNTVFKLSEGEIRINNSRVELISKNLSGNGTVTYLSKDIDLDNEWHHFAFTFSPTGGELYIDGGVSQPTNREQPIAANHTTSSPFVVGLNRASKFSFNANAESTYELDEIRIWSVKRTATQINNYWQYILGDNNEANLLAYYRLDMNDPFNIYNQAANSIGKFRGTTIQALQTVNPPYQVVTEEREGVTTTSNVPLEYAVYSNEIGRFRFNSLNTGRQSVDSSDNFLAYEVRPSKPNNRFSPTFDVRNIDRALNPRDPRLIEFSNVSQYQISGKILYKLLNGETFPTIQNTSIKVNGTEVTSSDPNSSAGTDNEGIYNISQSPGRVTVSVGQPNFDRANLAVDRVSLDFKKEDKGYAVSSRPVVATAGQGFTWSGFIKPDIFLPEVGNGNQVEKPENQTVLHWGDLRLELRNNNRLVLLSGTSELASTGIEEESATYTFFAITYDADTDVIYLKVEDKAPLNAAYTSNGIDNKVYVGATYVDDATLTNYSVANVDILEFRDTYYTPAKLSSIRSGDIVENDEDHLKLSYTFEHRLGSKAVNLATNSGVSNNYLDLKQGAYFNNESSSQYIRKFEFDYIASQDSDNARFIDPENNTQYVFNLTEATSDINFENTTRRTFVGNVVIPCNNDVGNWEGQIIRTDVAFPEYKKAITPSDFNDENNLFTIHDLLPGQYRVELTRVGTSDRVNSAIIDLRDGNKSYDFSYRNPLQAEVSIFAITQEQFQALQTREELESKRITATCGDGNSIYNLATGSAVYIEVDVFEDYNGDRCKVEDAVVDLSGDMIVAAANGKSGVNGKSGFLTTIGQPNFSGDFTRNLAISLAHNSRNISLTRLAYVTGAQRGNEDFTLTDPQVGIVLYDPPGDASSATLARGTSYSFSKSVGGGLDVNTTTAISAGLDINTETVNLAIAAPLGVGVASGVSTTVASSTSKTVGTITANATYRHTEENGFSVSLDQTIQTSTSTDIVGQDADVFVGVSRLLTFGTGRSLIVGENCNPIIRNDQKVVTTNELNPFIYSRQDIEDVVIPNLQRLLISRYDNLENTSQEVKDTRSSLDLQATIDGFNIDIASESTDKELGNYVHQIQQWRKIVQRRNKEEREEYLANNTESYSEVVAELSQVNDNLGATITSVPTQLSFSGGGNSITYNISGTVSSSTQNSGGTTGGLSGGGSTSNTIFGVLFNFDVNVEVLGTTEASDNTTSENSRTDSFTLSDNSAGDQFTVRIGRDKTYGTPYFYTVGGRSSCPFEAGTVPREGVEISVDNAVKYGVGADAIIEYELTLRNTQRANDATRKTYIVAMDGASNSNGAQVFLNESPIFEPATSSPIVFTLDPSSDTGVTKEVKAELKITRGMGDPEDITYENIKVRIYSECEQAGDRYRSYGVDEYAEVGVVPFQEIEVTAHFSGACISQIEASKPAANWVVNGEDNDQLDFRFRIPEITADEVTVADTFSVDLEYAIEGNNEPRILKTLSLTELRENLQEDGFITYSANVSSLTDGEYSFRVTPVCDPTRQDVANRQTPTEFAKGRIARIAPVVISTNPVNGGVLREGQITAEFNRAINPQTAVNSSFSLRGILGGLPQNLTSAEFAQIPDEVIVPHQTEFDLTGPFTLEMWVNPSTLPSGVNVPIIQKGNNYSVKLSPQGNIIINDVVTSSRRLQPLSWTHVAAVYDGANTVTIYFNGVSVGSGTITALEANEDAIEIAKAENGVSYIGKLDEIRIWNIDRSPSEIVGNLDEQLVGNETNLKAYFVLDNNALEGANGAPDEAIRDYTGNAIGTTAVGLEFVTGAANAAPLDITRLAKNLQYRVVVSHDNTQVHIDPVFDDSFIEGAQLTAMIRNRRLQDPAGNKIAGRSWSFTVNRNTIHWSQNNVIVSQVQGQSTRITNVDLDNSEGGSPVKYNFRNLPSWLRVERVVGPTVTTIEEGAENDLAAGFVERDLEFIVAPYLNPGVHSTDVYVEVLQTVDGRDIPLGVEAFNLEVNVTCAVPNFAEGFSSNAYLGRMNMTGKLMFGETQSLDRGDIVVAYLNGEYRGLANVGTNGLVNLSISGNNDESGILSFNVWDASECTEYKGIVERYTYSFRGSEGTTSDPITFTVGERVTKRLSLVENFQEVSFNLKDNDVSNVLSLTSIKGLTKGDQILDAKTTNLIATAGDNGTYTGTNGVEAIDVRKAYIINSTSSKIIEIEGVPVPIDTNIDIEGSKAVNAIPYFPNNLQTVSLALRSLTSTTVSVGDMIEGRGLIAEYTSNGWTGSLTHLTPGTGYLYRAENSGILNYSGLVSIPQAQARGTVAAAKEQSSLEFLEKAKVINWEVDRNRYPSFMYMTANVSSDDLDEDKEYIIAAFVNDEVRGVAKAVMIDDEYRYFIGVGGFSNDEVSFKLFDGENIVSLDNTISFDRTDVKGNVENPYTLTYTAKSIDEVNTIVNNGYSLGQNTPNPMTNSTKITYSIPQTEFVDISLYNLLGQKVHTFVSEKVEGNKVHTITWNKATSEVSVNRGVYLYKLISGNKVLTKKLVIK
ncbi:LamG-like jellyroll fold domain-containing protein [Tenacibaculum amylolyticum]